MNNQIKGRKRATSQKEDKATTKNAVTIVSQLGCISHDSDALASQGTKESRTSPMQEVLELIQRVRFAKSTLRQASIREQKGPSMGNINVRVLHQRSPYAMKFEDRSHEETERQQRCVRCKAWNIATSIHKLKEKDKAAFYFPAEEWVLPAASTKFVVDSGASMHMVIKKDRNSAELETMMTSRNPTTVMTANGEVQTREEATVYVKQLDLFIKVMILEETSAVLSLGNSVRTMGIHRSSCSPR